MNDARMARAINLSIAEGSLATVMGSLISGTFLTGFALAMGANQLQVGILAGLPVLANLLQIVGACIIERTGECKRICMRTSLGSRLLFLPAILIPSFFLQGAHEVAVWWMILAIGVSSALSSIGGVAWLVWVKSLIPVQQRIHFFGRRHLFNTALSLTMGMIGAIFLDWSHAGSKEHVWGFLTVFAVAIGCGLVGLGLLGQIPAPASAIPHRESLRSLIAGPFKDQNFRRLVAFYASWNLAVHLAQPFFAVYMLNTLGLSFAAVTGLATLSSISGLVTNNLWSRLYERFGSKPIILVATIGDFLFLLAWLMASPETIGLLVLIHLTGVFNAPLAMGPNNILLRLAPEKNAAPYLATFNAIVGPMSALASLIGGVLVSTMADFHWNIGIASIDAMKTVFLISALGRMGSLLLLLRVQEPDSQPVIRIFQALNAHGRRLVRHPRSQDEPADRRAA